MNWLQAIVLVELVIWSRSKHYTDINYQCWLKAHLSVNSRTHTARNWCSRTHHYLNAKCVYWVLSIECIQCMSIAMKIMGASIEQLSLIEYPLLLFTIFVVVSHIIIHIYNVQFMPFHKHGKAAVVSLLFILLLFHISLFCIKHKIKIRAWACWFYFTFFFVWKFDESNPVWMVEWVTERNMKTCGNLEQNTYTLYANRNRKLWVVVLLLLLLLAELSYEMKKMCCGFWNDSTELNWIELNWTELEINIISFAFYLPPKRIHHTHSTQKTYMAQAQANRANVCVCVCGW